MQRMRVLLQSRTNLFSVAGGDTVQILKTKKYLEKYGIDADISTELEPCVSKYDVVHLFNLMRGQEVYIQVRNAKKYRKPVVLSTIYVLYAEYDREARRGLARVISNMLNPFQVEHLKIIARAIVNKEVHKGVKSIILKNYYKCLKEVVESADVLLPNSNSEMERVKNDFFLVDPKFIVVPNGVDPEIFDYENTIPREAHKRFRDAILCVARIEGRKCQLELVKAIRDTPYMLVLVGKPAPNHKGYFKEVLREASKSRNIYYLGTINHDELSGLYKVAKVHALVSWMETTGLSSLEAAAMRCNIVATKKGDTYEYLRDYAYYCEPDDIDSIREAVVRAHESPFDERLRELVLSNYTWDVAAKKTLEGYKLALENY